MDELLRQLGASGPLGIITAIAIFIAWRKDQQVKELYDKMLARAERDRELNHTLAKELGKTVNALTEYEGE